MKQPNETKTNQPSPEQSSPPVAIIDPRMLAGMYGMAEEEIDLLEYWRTIWKRR